MLRLLVPTLILLSFATARAEDHQFLHNANPSSPLFECNQNTMGQMACQAGHRCKCNYSAFGSAMQGLPPGYRWDCGLEHGTCMSDVPATTSGSYGSAPAQSQTQIPTPQVIAPNTPNPAGSTNSSTTSTTSSTTKAGVTTTTTTTNSKSTTTK